jgi:hypothetical protein
MNTPVIVKQLSDAAMITLREAGLIGEGGERPEIHFNEWNYVREWVGEQYKYSRRVSKQTKGASFIAGCMFMAQASDIDMLMYYDARPGNWCGLFNTDSLDPLKPYYAFYMAKELPRLGKWVKSEARVGGIYSCASTDGRDSAIMITHFRDDEATPAEQVKVCIDNVKSENGVRVEYYLLDDGHDAELIREETFTAESFAVNLDMKLYDTYLIKIKAM